MAAHPYGAPYRRRREQLIGQPCVWCGRPADTADHVPPKSAFPPGEWVGRLLPACRRCNFGRRAAQLLKGGSSRRSSRSAPRRRRVLR